MKNKQVPKDKNERRIEQQQKKQAKVKQGNPASATPQGTGIGSSTQRVVQEKQGPTGDFPLEEPFTAVDPEMQRKEAAARQRGKGPHLKRKQSKEHRPATKKAAAAKPAPKTLDNSDKRNRESNEKKENKEDPAHWKGEGNPGYASSDPEQQRKLSEKGEI